MFRALVLISVAALAAPASAQIVTDRPDLTESTEAAAGVQIETGLVVERSQEVTDVTAPQALVRIGLAPGVEARLGLPDYRVLDLGGADRGGFTDPSVGVKAELGALAGWDVAAIAEVSLPLGDDAFSGSASPIALLIAGRDLDVFSLGTQAELRWDRDADRVDVGGTFVVGASFTERVGAFAEAAAASSAAGTEALAQVGATFLVSPDTQVDAFVGAGLTDVAPDVFGGVGFSTRF